MAKKNVNKNDEKLLTPLNQFLNYMSRSKRFSNNTLDAYSNDIRKFIDFLKKQKINEFNKVDEKIAAKYFKFLQDTLKERSVMRNVSSLKNFFNYLKRRGIYKGKNPFSSIKFSNIEQREIIFLSVKDVEKLMNVLKSDGFLETRNKAMILFIYNTGLRASEITEAVVDNLNLRKATYTCEFGGSKRVIPFSRKLVPILKGYLKEREKLLKSIRSKNKDEKYLFLNRRGRKITRQTVYIVVQKKAKEAKIKKLVTPSVLRNSLAVHLLSSGTREDIVKSILGYTTIVPKYEYAPITRRVKFEFLTTHPAFKKR